jgi:hypothetical protein
MWKEIGGTSLEDVVRSDIEKWLHETERAVTELERLSDKDRAERERIIRGSIAMTKKYWPEILAAYPAAADHPNFLSLITSAEFQRQIINVVRATLATGLLAEAYKLYSGFRALLQGVNHLLDQPDAIRGTTIAQAAKTGHEKVHGDDDEKHARWRRIYDDYKSERLKARRRRLPL